MLAFHSSVKRDLYTYANSIYNVLVFHRLFFAINTYRWSLPEFLSLLLFANCFLNIMILFDISVRVNLPKKLSTFFSKVITEYEFWCWFVYKTEECDVTIPVKCLYV